MLNVIDDGAWWVSWFTVSVAVSEQAVKLLVAGTEKVIVVVPAPWMVVRPVLVIVAVSVLELVKDLLPSELVECVIVKSGSL